MTMEREDNMSTIDLRRERTKRMLIRLAIAFSYAIWAAVSIDSTIKYNKKYGKDLLRFAYVTFILNASNSVLGLAELYSEEFMYALKNLLDLLLLIMTLPCLTTEVWLKYNVGQKEVAWLHSIIGALPTYIYVMQHYTRQDLIELTIAMNSVSLAGVGILYKDNYAIASSVLFILGFFVFRKNRNELAANAYSKQLFNYSMALFTYTACKAVL